MHDMLDLVIQMYLAGEKSWEQDQWQIRQIARGMNGIIYRMQFVGRRHSYGDFSDVAIKFCKLDSRNRAAREYASTMALHTAGQGISPKPLHIEHEPGGLSGVSLLVSTWVPGKPLEGPPAPQDKRKWRDILYALSAAHKLKPERTSTPIADAIMPIYNPVDLAVVLEERRARLPNGLLGALTHEQINQLLQLVISSAPEQWGINVPVGLILCDPNPHNMLAHDGLIRLVDWENSGWADPAFEIADLCAQPLYFDLPEETRAWIRAEHGRILNDKTLAQRAEIYERMMNIFWVLKMTDALTGGVSDRLDGVVRPSEEYIATMQVRYWERTCNALDVMI